ncbi:ArdC-like ssDNA-binding domain-containing protein [uncultured Granulicatella sp.]|uniref:ArdC-like ssDNA-binding domain-containing protein n=1 Tax=uncultured Granulicatella sp. TaxID=316089 RepID=UPI0028D698C6|nr:ArdC-like ssDNA-binding domain-containing protein [uncultured Granulicatella sp.]
MSNYKLVRIDDDFLSELVASTGSEEILDKHNRSYVGLYNEEENWYIPLRSKIGTKRSIDSYFETPFKTTSPHFVKPGLDFQKSLFVPVQSVRILNQNKIPDEQANYIKIHSEEIKERFEKYVLSVESYDKSSKDYLYSTVALFPEGIEKIKQLQQSREKVNEEIKQTKSVNEEIDLQTALANKDYTFVKEHLEKGIETYLDSETYKNFLSFLKTMNNYSQKNMRLLLAQLPTATMVASAGEWKKRGRFPKKGTKAIRIYSPIFEYQKDKDGNFLKDDNGLKIPTGKIEKWYFAPVFDVSQTQGRELPKPIYELTENFKEPKHFLSIFNAIKKCTTALISLQEISREGVKGFYNPDTHSIVIRKGMNQYQTLKTEIHEVVHSILHQKNSELISREQKEFEAESVAYIVCKNYGVDTSDYSFGYLSSWTDRGDRISEFENSLKRITSTAREMIVKIDKEISQQLIIKENTIEQQTNKFTERLNLAQQQLNQIPKKDNVNEVVSVKK